jgi:hypothetical protein
LAGPHKYFYFPNTNFEHKAIYLLKTYNAIYSISIVVSHFRYPLWLMGVDAPTIQKSYFKILEKIEKIF